MATLLPESGKEEIKLRATFLNSLAIGQAMSLAAMAGSVTVCFVVGYGLHLVALRSLGRLDP